MRVIDLGITHYGHCYKTQKKLVVQRKLGIIDDTAIITEHHPVITLGRSGRRENILVDASILEGKGIPVLETDRGGDITFHGPGQVILYPVIDLKERGRDMHRYLRDLEEVAIGFLSAYGIAANRVTGRTGVWVEGRKVASIGVGASNWVTYHGMAINIDVDLSCFTMIHPCGLKDISMTSLVDILGRPITTAEVSRTLLASFAMIFRTLKGDPHHDRCQTAVSC